MQPAPLNGGLNSCRKEEPPLSSISDCGKYATFKSGYYSTYHLTVQYRRAAAASKPPLQYTHGSGVGGENAISCTAPSKKFGKIERPDIFRIGGRRRTLIYGQINYAALPTARRRRPKSFAKPSLGCVDAVMCPSSSLCGNPLCHRRGEKTLQPLSLPLAQGSAKRALLTKLFPPPRSHNPTATSTLPYIAGKEGGGEMYFMYNVGEVATS